jgi:hypothetical protein
VTSRDHCSPEVRDLLAALRQDAPASSEHD